MRAEQRAFGIDVLACPQCNGRLRLVTMVEDPQAVRALLESLGLPAAVPHPRTTSTASVPDPRDPPPGGPQRDP